MYLHTCSRIKASVTVGRKRVKQHPESFPRTEIGGEHLLCKRLDRGEVTYESKTSPQCDQYPSAVFDGFESEFARRHWRIIEFSYVRRDRLRPWLLSTRIFWCRQFEDKHSRKTNALRLP